MTFFPEWFGNTEPCALILDLVLDTLTVVVVAAFVVVVVGGIGSIGGALAAGLGLGLFTAFFGAFVAHAYTTAAAFALMLASDIH